MKTLSFFLVIILFACGKSEKEAIKPQVQSLTESVYSSVTIQPDSLYQVYSTVNGILDNFYVTEGDEINAGSAIAQIINTVPELNGKNAKLALNLAKQNAGKNSTILGGIADEINNAKLRVKNDSLNYLRQQNLRKKGLGAQAQYDASKLAYQTSTNAVKMLRDKYIRTELELNTNLNQATNHYKSAISNSKDFTITSKINGKVYKINSNKGELISVQSPIASIGSKKNYLIEMLIDEVDITKIELNQDIIIKLDAYEKEVFKAKIVKIYPSKDIRTQTFKIEGKFINRPKKLYPGLTGEANIIIQTRENILTIPNEYVNENNQVNTGKELIDVVVGIKNLEKIEIISGIDSSTLIYKLN